MGKKTYNVDGRLCFVDEENGKVKEVVIKETPVRPEVFEKLIKIMAEENSGR